MFCGEKKCAVKSADNEGSSCAESVIVKNVFAISTPKNRDFNRE